MSNKIDRVVITGASSGMGFDMARRFLAEGSRVLVNARDPERLEMARRRLEGGQRVVAVAGHVGEPGTARAVVAAARDHLAGSTSSSTTPASSG
jgi:NAD(P)-dependent dehydrogenase (short-subunit alcohol dehydrogenase family)